MYLLINMNKKIFQRNKRREKLFMKTTIRMHTSISLMTDEGH